jgi:2-dehydro-3-deoxyphosphogalactonate aldolase
VTEIEQVKRIKSAGGQLIVMPHSDPIIIKTAKDLGMVCMPGFSTASEAYTALRAGADALKWFPAGPQNPDLLSAIMTVLPENTLTYAVGGITLANMAEFKRVGARGFGLGSILYKPGMEISTIKKNAEQFVNRFKQLYS